VEHAENKPPTPAPNAAAACERHHDVDLAKMKEHAAETFAAPKPAAPKVTASPVHRLRAALTAK